MKSISRGEDKRVPTFKELVDQFGDDLYRMAFAQIGNREDAEDILQETFLAIHQGLDRFQGRSSVKTWIVGILLNKIADHRRFWRIRKLFPLHLLGEQNAEQIETPTVDKLRQDREAKLDIARSLEKLPVKQKEIFLLREIMRLSYSEIAEVLRIPIGTVESRVFRARREMRKLLKDYSEDR